MRSLPASVAQAAKRTGVVALLACVALLATGPHAHAATTPALQAGAGRADITPPTGYPFGGWTRADRLGHGVHTRLYTSAIVLKRGAKKVALVAADLFMIPGGIIKEVADRLAARGYSEGNIVLSVSHTHSGPSRFANFETLNTLAPSSETVTSPQTFVALLQPGPPDQQLYTFLVERIALAIRRADDDLAPSVAAWGIEHLRGVTKNRSIEAHLANHGVIREYGHGKVEEDPGGYEHTIDSEVRVLRVDRLGKRVRRCRGSGAARRCTRKRTRIPLGGWSSFANHGTVNPSKFPVYTRDHHGAAMHVFEREVRRIGRVPSARPVLNVYGNSNEGDQSAGLDGQGPRIAERVGRAEAEAMLRAWRSAGRRLATRPALDVRWTRVCFCGQQTSAGPVASSPLPGVPFLTGSEEERGPLFDLTQEPFEGLRSPVGYESQGHKIGVPSGPGGYPRAVPLFLVRVGDRLIVSLPGEPTVEIGRRARAAVLEAGAGMGVKGAMVAGLTNEFIQYLTTPEEYDRQHYEGGSTIFGPASPVLLVEQLAELAARMARGQDAQAPYPFDPRNGVRPGGAPFGDGAAGGRIVEEPAGAVGPGGHARLTWSGGARGLDRRLDDPFVIVERRSGARWVRAGDDLGMNVVWTVAPGTGTYTARWEVPGSARAGTYRLVIAANRYRLESRPFAVDRAKAPEQPPASDPIGPFMPYTGGE